MSTLVVERKVPKRKFLVMVNLKITASSEKEFNDVLEEVKKLPTSISNQIEYAEKKNMFIHCKFFRKFDVKVVVFITKETTQIETSENGFCSYDEKFKFEMTKEKGSVFQINLR